MAHSIVMPALEMAQETGKLLSWRKKEGDKISKGEPLLEVETDKAVVEIEAPADGMLAGIKAREGDVIPVGQTIGWIVAQGEEPPAEEVTAASGRHMEAKTLSGSSASSAHLPALASANSAGTSGRVSPKARRLARERGVDLAQVRGSGSEGEILTEDVLAFAASSGLGAGTSSTTRVSARTGQAEARLPDAQAVPTEALSQVARLMAERTTQSWTTVPHFFVTREIDAGALIAARESLGPSIEKEHGVRLSHTDLLVACVAYALSKHPLLNATWTGHVIRQNTEINVGIAMAVDDGVVAAVIPSTNKKRLGEIAVVRQDLTERARAGKLRPADITGGTFTISNLGMYNVDAFTAIIVPPQAAILAVGRITDRVVPIEGKPGIRPMLTVTLSCDHRVADGARAALFLNDLTAAIVQPEMLLR